LECRKRFEEDLLGMIFLKLCYSFQILPYI
jgi:hypothetical protein